MTDSDESPSEEGEDVLDSLNRRILTEFYNQGNLTPQAVAHLLGLSDGVDVVGRLDRLHEQGYLEAVDKPNPGSALYKIDGDVAEMIDDD